MRLIFLYMYRTGSTYTRNKPAKQSLERNKELTHWHFRALKPLWVIKDNITLCFCTSSTLVTQIGAVRFCRHVNLQRQPCLSLVTPMLCLRGGV